MLCKTTLHFLFFLTSIQAIAQSVSVKGTITDNRNFPLPGVTVKLSNLADSLSVYGATTNDPGQFSIEAKTAIYQISISMMGFRSRQIQLDLSGKTNTELDTIKLDEHIQQLREATVKQGRSAVQFEAGKTVVTPELSVLGGQGDVFSVLKNIPGLFVTEDGGIILNGQSGVHVRINAKDTYLTGAALANFLKSLQAGSVESIEVISSPSSAYDAAGKAGIINITLKKNATKGFTLGGGANLQQSRHHRSDWGLRTTIRKRRAGFGIDYSGATSERLKQGLLVRTIEATVPRHSAQQTISLHNQDLMHGLKIFADFELSKRFSIEANAGRNFYQRTTPGHSMTTFTSAPTDTDSLLRTSSYTRYRQITNTGGIQAAYRDEKQRELVIAANHLSFSHRESLAMSSATDYPGQANVTDTLNGNFGDRIKVFSAQADWQSRLTNRAKFQAGIKTAHVVTNNHAIYNDIHNGEAQLPSAQSVRYRYAERTSAAYAQVSGSSKKWSYTVGTRMENTDIQGNISHLAGQKDSSYHRTYTRLFPSVNVQYALSEQQQLALSYVHRIMRPNYRDLSPSGYMVDRYVMVNGNPALLPELTRNAEMTYITGHSWRSSLYYTTNSKTIAQSFRVREGGGLQITPENLSSRKTLGIKLDGTDVLPIKWWQLGGSISISGVSNQWLEDGVSLRSRKIVPMAHVTNGWIIGDGWSAELNGYYNGRMLLSQIEVPPVWSVSAGIRKKMADGRLTMRLYGTDLLASLRERSVFRNRFISGITNLRYEETYVGLSVQYTFKRGLQKELKENNNEEKKRINF